MPTLKITPRGPLFDGTAERALPVVQRSWLQGVGRTYRDKAKELAPVATGTVRGSIRYRTGARRASAFAHIYSTLPDEVIDTVEAGREAGKPPPPPGSLLAWLAVRGIEARAEFAVARKIGAKGLWGHFMFSRAFHALRGLLHSQQRLLATSLAKSWSG